MSDPNRMRALGKAGGKASGEARRKRRSRSFLDVLRARVSSDPEALVEQLLSSSAGSVVAARVLERAGDFASPDESAPALHVAHDPELIMAQFKELGLVIPLLEAATDPSRGLRADDPAATERAAASTTPDLELDRGGEGVPAESVGVPSNPGTAPTSTPAH